MMKRINYNMSYASETVIQVSPKTTEVSVIGGNNIEYGYNSDSMEQILEVTKGYLKSDGFYFEVLKNTGGNVQPKISVEVLADMTSFRLAVSSSDPGASETFLKESIRLFQENSGKVIGRSVFSVGDIKNSASNVLYSTKMFVLVLLLGFLVSAVITWLHVLLSDRVSVEFLKDLGYSENITVLPKRTRKMERLFAWFRKSEVKYSDEYSISLMKIVRDIMDSKSKTVLLTGIAGKDKTRFPFYTDLALFFAGRKKKTLILRLSKTKMPEKLWQSCRIFNDKIPALKYKDKPLFVVDFADISLSGKSAEDVISELFGVFDTVFTEASVCDIADNHSLKYLSETVLFAVDKNCVSNEQVQESLGILGNLGIPADNLVLTNH